MRRLLFRGPSGANRSGLRRRRPRAKLTGCLLWLLVLLILLVILSLLFGGYRKGARAAAGVGTTSVLSVGHPPGHHLYTLSA